MRDISFQLLFGKYDLCISSIFLYAFNAVLAGRLGSVAFACADDLTVRSLQTETEFALFVSIHLELRTFFRSKAFNRLTEYGITSVKDRCAAFLLIRRRDSVGKSVEHLKNLPTLSFSAGSSAAATAPEC